MTAKAGTRPMQKADLFRLHFLQGATLSPDGKHAAYSLSETDPEADADYYHLWLMNLETGATRRLTFGEQQNTSPAFSPDGRALAFVSDRSGKAQIYLLQLDGGEARPLTDLAQGVVGGPVWSPDGATLAFTAGPPVADAVDTDSPYRLTRTVYRYDAIGYLDKMLEDIYVAAVETGETRRLTRGPTHDTDPRWSPDGAALLYRAELAPDSHRSLAPELHVVTLDGVTHAVVGHGWGELTGVAAWLPDGERIAFSGHPNGLPIGSKSDLYVIDVNAAGAAAPENRTTGLPVGVAGRLQGDMPSALVRSASPILIARDGLIATVRVQQGGALHIYQIALAGPEAWHPLIEGDRSCFPIALGDSDRKLLFAASDFNAPPDLFLFDSGHAHERQVTSLNATHLSTIRQPLVEHLRFSGSDGAEVEGWLVRPDTDEAPHPAVLYIHGGPHSAFGHIFHFDTQMLAGAGYAVLLINHRASTGYGDEFSTAIKGDWGNLDFGDLMAGVDAAIDRGWIDPDRLGVCGLSGGGNLSCWIIGQTDRFKAAAPENPVTNWVSFYGVSDIGIWFSVQELGGHPHEIPEVYAACSPITYAHRCTTPTLLVQCEGDFRCPAEQSEQFYSVLKANGCTVEMLRLPGGFHAGAIVGKPKLRRAQNDALLDWMNRYVLGYPADASIT